MKIKYVVGDMLSDIGNHTIAITHVVNDVGAFGAGVAKQIAEKYPDAKQFYLDWFKGIKGKTEFKLGNIALAADGRVWIVHMIAQHGLYKARTNENPLDLIALDSCLEKLSQLPTQVLIRMPMIGTGLARGKWKDIEPLIAKHLVNHDVTVYRLK